MGTQRVGPRLMRRIARDVGEPVRRAWGFGGYVMEFTTFDHRHGAWSKVGGEVTWLEEHEILHFTTCRSMFGDAPTEESTCGARQTLQVDGAPYDVICEREEPDHTGAHVCGSLSWWDTPVGPLVMPPLAPRAQPQSKEAAR